MQTLLEFLSTYGDAIAVIALVGGMLGLFIKEIYPVEVVALTGAAILLAAGILPLDQAFSVFSNPAPWTIAAMFILTGALMRTGALSTLTSVVTSSGSSKPALTLAGLTAFVVFASAFMNNTPIVVLMIPIVIQVARQVGTSASRLLIPLSYVSILGGTCTLIGTSTNLLVNGVAQAQGLESFSLFEVTPLAIILVLFGVLYLRIFAPRLLPERDAMSELLRDRSRMRFFVEVVLPHHSELISKKVSDITLFKHRDIRIIDVLRGSESLKDDLTNVELKPDDRLVLKTYVSELNEILGHGHFKKSGDNPDIDGSVNNRSDNQGINKVHSRQSKTLEVLISPGCRMIGQKLGDLDLQRQFKVYTIAMHRPTEKAISDFANVRLRIGDTLLLEGDPKDIHRMAHEFRLVEISEPSSQPYRRRKAPIAILTLVAVVLFAGLGIAPISLLCILAVTVVLVFRCIDSEEAFQLADARLLVLIWSMLAVGAAMQTSGAVELIGQILAPNLAMMTPFFLVWSIYLMTSVLTELVTNNAVAVVVTPIVIGMAASIGVDPRGLVVAVMISASASFATPIGYQTNTLVYGPGGYEFKDYLRIGIPLNLSIGIIASLIIPYLWPLN